MSAEYGQVLGGYRLLELIGRGRMGEVWLAQHVMHEAELRALRVVRPDLAAEEDFRQRFLRQAAFLQALHHPHIQMMMSAREESGVLFLVMEHLDGRTAAELQEEHPGGLSIDAAVELVRQAAEGVAYAHGKGIVHGDLNAANLMVTAEGMIKLLDFGITRHGSAAGTSRPGAGYARSREYLAPEVAATTAVTQAADIYALGIALYEAVVGRLPFLVGAGATDSSTAPSLMIQHATKPVPLMRAFRIDVPEALDRIVQRATAKSPAARLPSAAELAAELAALETDAHAGRVELATRASGRPGHPTLRAPAGLTEAFDPGATAPPPDWPEGVEPGPPEGAELEPEATPRPHASAWKPAVAALLVALIGAGAAYAWRAVHEDGGLGHKPKPVTGCSGGLETSVDTDGHCCWPSQVWQRNRCVGIPAACPPGLAVDMHGQGCVTAPCTDGRVRVADGVHCCWADQGWSVARQQCAGVPTCPAGLAVEGEDCRGANARPQKPSPATVEANETESGDRGTNEKIGTRHGATRKTAAEPAEAANAEPLRVEPKSGLAFIHFAGGTFHRGCEPQDDHCENDEKKGRQTTVGAMWMGRTDVTVAAYERCVTAGACTTPGTGGDCNWEVPGREQHPINCVDWDQAVAFCAWIGGRLPTAVDWEYAAKGGESRIYPWGNAPVDGTRANFCDSQCKSAHPEYHWADSSFDDGWPSTSVVGSYRAGTSKQGLLDLAGNVWQWTASNYDAKTKEIRGGSWNNGPGHLRASHRNGIGASGRTSNVGLRCAH